ncbi:hypothetical protein fugu_001911 [Takifugu bimaculatus]|uniref:Uncharacterized protein n=1 Tax=Takifugu bimaculatus TaxID=433685 RepID=A0A4Z2BN71_9TELE|nr:hypothetical protein fugu_001911 [Takifugu bimaculatus]
MAELQKLQKMKMMMSLQNGNESDNDDLHSNAGGSECSWDKDRLTSPPAGAHSGGSVSADADGALSNPAVPIKKPAKDKDSAVVEDKPELNGNQQDNAAVQESRAFLKTPMMF